MLFTDLYMLMQTWIYHQFPCIHEREYKEYMEIEPSVILRAFGTVTSSRCGVRQPRHSPIFTPYG